MVQTPRTSHGNYHRSFCCRHGTPKNSKCEQYGKEWTEQDDVTRNFIIKEPLGPAQNHVNYKNGQESLQAARDVWASRNGKDGNQDAQNDNEPPSKKAKHKEYTVTDGIFDFVESLDDQHLMAAFRIVKAAIEYRQENTHFKEKNSTCIMGTQFCAK